MHFITSTNTVVTEHCHMSWISISALLYIYDELAATVACGGAYPLGADPPHPPTRRDVFNTVQC